MLIGAVLKGRRLESDDVARSCHCWPWSMGPLNEQHIYKAWQLGLLQTFYTSLQTIQRPNCTTTIAYKWQKLLTCASKSLAFSHILQKLVFLCQTWISIHPVYTRLQINHKTKLCNNFGLQVVKIICMCFKITSIFSFFTKVSFFVPNLDFHPFQKKWWKKVKLLTRRCTSPL